jgi:hypothetical protein
MGAETCRIEVGVVGEAVHFDLQIVCPFEDNAEAGSDRT